MRKIKLISKDYGYGCFHALYDIKQRINQSTNPLFLFAMLLTVFFIGTLGANTTHAKEAYVGKQFHCPQGSTYFSLSEVEKLNHREHAILHREVISHIETFPYIRNTVKSWKHKWKHNLTICFGGIILDRSPDFGYNKYFGQLEAYSDGQRVSFVPILFQSASTQAFQNFDEKPWIALIPDRVNDFYKELLLKTKISYQTTLPGFHLDSVKKIIKKIILKKITPFNGIFIMPIDHQQDGVSHYLASWITPIPNTFFVSMQSMLIRYSNRDQTLFVYEFYDVSKHIKIPLGKIYEDSVKYYREQGF